MQLSPVLAACQNLFNVQPFLAHGIMPTLRLEDIKIAFAKRIRVFMEGSNGHPSSNGTEKYLNSYNTLAEYIMKYNLEVLLTLESYSDNTSSNTSYLYPQYSNQNSPFINLRSVISKKELYFKGALPVKRLRLSSFLYYKGLISNYQVLESIAWQKDRRPLMGQMAMQIGKLTADDFARIIVHVKNGECFGQVAIKLMLLSKEVIVALVKTQEKYDCRIGRYFTQKSLLSEDDITRLNAEMLQHNSRFSH